MVLIHMLIFKDTLRETHRLPKKNRGSAKIANLARLARDFVDRGRAEGIDFYNLYRSWRRFNRQLLVDQPPSVARKARFLRWYWDHIGTALAHGRVPGFGWAAHFGDAFG